MTEFVASRAGRVFRCRWSSDDEALIQVLGLGNGNHLSARVFRFWVRN